jgi:hypothetical protein
MLELAIRVIYQKFFLLMCSNSTVRLIDKKAIEKYREWEEAVKIKLEDIAWTFYMA